MRLKELALAGALALTLAPAAHAERVVLTFDGVAYGVIGLGTASMDLGVEAGGYQAAAAIKSSGLAALFDNTDLKARVSGAVDGPRVAWGRYSLDHGYARKRRLVEMRATPGGVEQLVTPDFGFKGDPPPSDEQKRAARDPLSSLVAMAVQVKQTGTCAGVFPTYDGRYRYDLAMRVEGKDTHRGGGYNGPVLKCKLRYTPVSGYKRDTNMGRRIPEGEIWFALEGAETFAPPVRISAPLPLGVASIRLASFKRAEVTIVADAPEAP